MSKFPIFLLCIALVGCGSTGTYKQILKEKEIPNVKVYQADNEDLINSISKVMMRKQFMIEASEDPSVINASRYFSSNGKRRIIVLMQARIMKETNDSYAVFLNAVETTERSYVKDNTRHLLFLVPLPGGGGKEISTGKESQYQIKDPNFYNTFFNMLSDEINKLNSNDSELKENDENSVIEELSSSSFIGQCPIDKNGKCRSVKLG